MSGYPKYEIRTVIREDIRISEIRQISVISYPISELYYPNSNPKSENSVDIRKKLSNRIISLFGRSNGICIVYTPCHSSWMGSQARGSVKLEWRQLEWTGVDWRPARWRIGSAGADGLPEGHRHVAANPLWLRRAARGPGRSQCVRILRSPAARTAGDPLGVIRRGTTNWWHGAGRWDNTRQSKSVLFCSVLPALSHLAFAELQGLHYRL
jgi:hypothetical protein